MKIYRFACVLVVLLIIGCAVPATNVNSLRGAGSEHMSFDTAKSYLPVYETVLKNGKKCWDLTDAGMVVENELSEKEK